MRKIATTIILFILFSVAGCLVAPIPIDPQQPPYVPIPEWVDEAWEVSYYVRSLPGVGYQSDESLTGYSNYYFTPAEFFMTEIPDVNNPERTITKPKHRGDCDDFAIVMGYIAQVALNAKAHYVVIRIDGAETKYHAITYVPAYEGGVHVFDLWYYKGKHESIEAYVGKVYPDAVISKDIYLDDFLTELFQEGHVRYYCPDNYCQISYEEEQ